MGWLGGGGGVRRLVGWAEGEAVQQVLDSRREIVKGMGDFGYLRDCMGYDHELSMK